MTSHPADPGPFAKFASWFSEACESGLREPNAMSLATADRRGRVTCRTVLLKAWDERGFVFFTNYESAKAVQLTENPHAALVFPWQARGREIRISGSAARISTRESLAYFLKRPFQSRLGAWVSVQSQVISSRAILEAKFEQMMRKFADGKVPLPEAWGGFRVEPERMEFSQVESVEETVLIYRRIGGAWRQEN